MLVQGLCLASSFAYAVAVIAKPEVTFKDIDARFKAIEDGLKAKNSELKASLQKKPSSFAETSTDADGMSSADLEELQSIQNLHDHLGGIHAKMQEELAKLNPPKPSSLIENGKGKKYLDLPSEGLTTDIDPMSNDKDTNNLNSLEYGDVSDNSRAPTVDLSSLQNDIQVVKDNLESDASKMKDNAFDEKSISPSGSSMGNSLDDISTQIDAGATSYLQKNVAGASSFVETEQPYEKFNPKAIDDRFNAIISNLKQKSEQLKQSMAQIRDGKASSFAETSSKKQSDGQSFGPQDMDTLENLHEQMLKMEKSMKAELAKLPSSFVEKGKGKYDSDMTALGDEMSHQELTAIADDPTGSGDDNEKLQDIQIQMQDNVKHANFETNKLNDQIWSTSVEDPSNPSTGPLISDSFEDVPLDASAESYLQTKKASVAVDSTGKVTNLADARKATNDNLRHEESVASTK